MFHSTVETFRSNYSKVLKKEATFVKDKLLFIEIPEKGLLPQNIQTTINTIDEFVYKLYLFTCTDGTTQVVKTKNGIDIKEIENPIHLTLRELEHPNKNPKPYVVISFNELNFDPECKYELYPRWWTLKDTFNSKQVISIYDIDKFFDIKCELGDLSTIGFDTLFNLTRDYSLIQEKYKTFTHADHEYVSYNIGNQLSFEIDNYTKKAVNIETYRHLLTEEDLYFSANIQPFNYCDKSYVLNTVSGQGDTIYNIIELNEFCSNFPEVPFEITMNELSDMLAKKGIELVQVDDETYTVKVNNENK